MSLSDISIKNPVFAFMLSAAMIVFGYLGYREMGISQFPEIDFPVVSITTYREQANPEIMDSDVTDIVEDAVSNVEGIDYIQSQSLEGVSVVTVFFHLNRDIDVAMQDVQNAVAAAANRLPNDIDPPIISKVNFNKFPVIWLSIHGHQPIQKINQFVDDHLKQRIETIPGCGGVMYGGLRPRTMRLWLDRDALTAYNLDALDAMRAVRQQHVERPAGYLQGQKREMNVRVMGEARTARDFEAIPMFNRDGQIVHLGEVAVIEDGLADNRGFARFNREPNVGVGVFRATGANVVEVCDEVKRRLPELRKTLPPGMEISISTDYSLFIKDDIEEVNQALLYGIALTALVTFLFLGSLGTTLNVCVSIPTSLIGTFLAMKWFGFTVNFMTLLALSLSVGVVVDDAILVLENIYRRREHGEEKRSAAIRGAREISFAAIAATFSIAAIFIPVAFMRGSIGRFFFQFGITVTVAVLLSLVVSLTITPVLCSLFLAVRQMRRPCPRAWTGLLGPIMTLAVRCHWLVDRWILEPLLVRPMDRFMGLLSRFYAVLLRHALRHQWWVAPAAVLLAFSALALALGVTIPVPEKVLEWLNVDGCTLKPGLTAERTDKAAFAIKPIGKELVPSEDQNRFIINVICPVGVSIDYVDLMLIKGEKILSELRDPVTDKEIIAGMFAAVSIRPGSLISEGILFVRLIPADERSWTQTDVINQCRERFKNIPGMRAVVLDLSTQGFTPTRGYPVDFAVQGPDWKKVTELSERIAERMTDSGVVTDVNSDYRPGMPEVHLVPDRDKCAELGIPIQRLAFTLNVAFGGVRNGRFTDLDKRYDVRLRFLEQQRESPDQLDQLFVKTNSGQLVPLSDVTRARLPIVPEALALLAVAPNAGFPAGLPWGGLGFAGSKPTSQREIESTLPIINRYNHLRKVELTANMAPGVSQGEAIARSQEIAEEVREEMGLPASYRIVQLGNAQAMQETLDSLWWALALGFVVATMILGVQFNSFVHPFTVLMAVPFGVTGALAVLWAANDTLNLMSMIGMVLLAGLVKKNSIILVDYTNQLRAEGLGLKDAVLTACPIRLRPILMTSLATMAAAVPMALGYGAGAETRAPLARSILGGIFLSTLVTLVIVPIFYVLFDRFGHWVYGLTRRGEGKKEPQRHREHREESGATTNGSVGVGSAPTVVSSS
jgi:multidrug efflux pump subunit AcrB